uniref:BED-type domain-containing protein n=1 Tax=Rhabditophanes sp. KR3021 TaxID=114890 RepID=A0AC35TXI9_9BILA
MYKCNPKMNGVSNLKSHFNNKHKDIALKPKVTLLHQNQSTAAQFFKPKERIEPKKDDVFYSLLTKFVASTNFSMVANPTFKALIEHTTKFKLPSRNTMVKSINEQACLIKAKMLLNISEGWAFTVDGMDGFYPVTARFYDDNGAAHTKILTVLLPSGDTVLVMLQNYLESVKVPKSIKFNEFNPFRLMEFNDSSLETDDSSEEENSEEEDWIDSDDDDHRIQQSVILDEFDSLGKNMILQLNKRIEKIITNPTLLMATYPNPEYCLRNFFNARKWEEIRQLIDSKIDIITSTPDNNLVAENKNDMFQFIDEVNIDQEETLTMSMNYQKCIKKAGKFKCADDFWNTNKVDFPEYYKLYRIFNDSIDGDTKNAAQRELMIRVNKVTTIPNYEKAKELADDFQSKMKKKKREKNDIFPIFFDEKDKGNFTKNFNFIMKKEDTSGKVGITIKKILQAFSEDDDESWWWNRLDQFHSDSLIERIVTGATWKLFDFTYIKVDDIAKYKCLACSEEFYLSSESRNHMRERKCEGWEDKAKEISSRYDAVAFMSLLDEMTPRPEDRRCDLYIHLDPRKLNTASPQKNVIYVGETGDFIYRMSQHADEYYTAVKRKNIDGDKSMYEQGLDLLFVCETKRKAVVFDFNFEVMETGHGWKNEELHCIFGNAGKIGDVGFVIGNHLKSTISLIQGWDESTSALTTRFLPAL